MPLLVMTVGVQTATPLVAFMGFAIATSIPSRDWRDVDIKAAWRLIVSSLVGSKLNRSIPPGRFEGVVHGFLVLIGTYLLMQGMVG